VLVNRVGCVHDERRHRRQKRHPQQASKRCTRHGSAMTQGAKKTDGSRAAHAGICTIFANAKSSNQTTIALANPAALRAVMVWFFCMVLRDPSDGYRIIAARPVQ
jgi:hypothetical protein